MKCRKDEEIRVACNTIKKRGRGIQERGKGVHSFRDDDARSGISIVDSEIERKSKDEEPVEEK